jgi:hypothetical protein
MSRAPSEAELQSAAAGAAVSSWFGRTTACRAASYAGSKQVGVGL